jgi:hypothetical protein
MTGIVVPSRLLPNRQRDTTVKPTGNVVSSLGTDDVVLLMNGPTTATGTRSYTLPLSATCWLSSYSGESCLRASTQALTAASAQLTNYIRRAFTAFTAVVDFKLYGSPTARWQRQ